MKKKTKGLISAVLVCLTLWAILFSLPACSAQKSSTERIETLSDFSGKTVGILAGTVFDEFIDVAVSGVDYKEYKDISSEIVAIERGDIDGIGLDMPVAKLLTAQHPEYGIFPEKISSDEFGYALQKNSPYTERFSEVIERFREDGTMDALQDKWFSGDESRMVIDWPQYRLEGRSNGTLRYVCVSASKPMSYTRDRGSIEGFEVELLLKIADQLDMGVELQTVDFSELINYVTSDKADVSSGCISITEERRQLVDFPVSHYEGGSVIVCKRERIPTGDIDLNDPSVTIAVEVSTTPEAAAREAYPKANFMSVMNAADGFLAVQSGKATAYAVDQGTFDSAVRSGMIGLRMHSDGTVGETGNVAVGVSPETKIPDALGKMNAFLDEMEENGTLEDMHRRWNVERDYTMPQIAEAEAPTSHIVMGTTGLVEPYSFYEGTDITGFDVELMRRFALWCGASYEIAVYDWSGILSACATGKVDYVFSNLFETPERSETIDFSRPYVSVHTVMATADDVQIEKKDFFQDVADSFEKTFIRENRWELILDGLLVTIEITIFTGLIGTVLGFGLCLVQRSKNKLVSGLSDAFCKLIQGVPSLVVLMIIYFVIFGRSSISPMVIGVIAFSIMFSVSVAGILNSGIEAVPIGQWEAAETLGFSKALGFVRIILPQAMRHVLPLYKGEFVSMLKLTAIVGYISVEDLTNVSDIIRSRTYEAFFPLITTAVIYFMISSVATALIGRVELRIAPDRRPRRLPKGVADGELAVAPTGKKRPFTDGELIRIEHLEKAYPNATPLSDVNASIERGEIVTIIGPSGTGKSTLMRCINRLEIPTKGRIIVFGENVCDKKTDLNAIRRRMGMVFQSFNLFGHLTSIENIMLAPTLLLGQSKQEAYENAMRLLKSVGMAEKALSYPDELSGGQQQRVAIARTLAMEPEIVLLDEPTSALDPTMTGEVLAVIRQLASQGYTMLIVTHEMQFARDVSTRIFYMDQGVIYEDGTPDQVFEHPRGDRTRAFVQRLKVLSFEITSPDYDFIAMSESLQQFGEKYRLPRRQTEALRRAFEEICALNIVPNKADTHALTVLSEYSEEKSEVKMRFVWGGARYSPMEEGDELSVRLIKGYIKSSDYSFSDGENRLTVLL